MVGGGGPQSCVPVEHRQHLWCGCVNIFLTRTHSQRPTARQEFTFAGFYLQKPAPASSRP